MTKQRGPAGIEAVNACRAWMSVITSTPPAALNPAQQYLRGVWWIPQWFLDDNPQAAHHATLGKSEIAVPQPAYDAPAIEWNAYITRFPQHRLPGVRRGENGAPVFTDVVVYCDMIRLVSPLPECKHVKSHLLWQLTGLFASTTVYQVGLQQAGCQPSQVVNLRPIPLDITSNRVAIIQHCAGTGITDDTVQATYSGWAQEYLRTAQPPQSTSTPGAAPATDNTLVVAPQPNPTIASGIDGDTIMAEPGSTTQNGLGVTPSV
ncbi:hypothetical protein WOLCODRAFT_21378 [Wolfiporia cocos MD-104 SS10]|uniref:Uncharacterized protein n=1 Tax=Wolfiporia cocos (strain MD-104) TaxID=742152 RepID=A0A2H3JH59_WOLCO|nr:hypothetical protein WOLCODRAFT_21378 [Wolfiporia cocos MD-104 SS10]